MELASPPPRNRGERASLALTGLFLLALCYALYVGRVFFLPIVVAVLLHFLLSPITRTLRRARIPEPLGAALVLGALLAGGVAAGYDLAGPTRAWLAKAPASVSQAQARLKRILKPMEQVTRTAEQMERATDIGPARGREVIVKGPSLGERLFGTTQSLVGGAISVLILLYFLLASGDLLLRKLIRIAPQLGDRERAVAMAREAEGSVSRYLLTLTVINAGQGALVAAAMALLGVPNPLLWGTLTTVLEFIPYVGAIAVAVVLTLLGFTTFDVLGQALLVPAAFLTINFVVANFVTPPVLGRQLLLNPVAIVLGLFFWSSIWGVAGAFVAVPILATFKIVCDHVEGLGPVGELLGK